MHAVDPTLMTFANAAFIGVVLMLIAARLRIPAIVPLLFGGVLSGPQYLGLVDPTSLGDTLRPIILIAVSIILFEGGLTLDPSGFRRAPVVIRRLLTWGVLITWIGVAAALYLLMDLPLTMAALGGSLVIVTGPTVITPILRRVRLEHRLDSILRWEGVLIDPVGVFVAVVLFEFVASGGAESPVMPFLGFAARMGTGLGIGAVAGFLLDWANRHRWIPEESLNLVALTGAIFVFWVCEMVGSESGLLAVVVMGFVLAVRKSPRLRELVHFKQELTELSIAVLFILLAARLDLRAFSQLGVGGALAVLSVVLVRIANVSVATWGLDFGWREKAFLGWVAPRGIVAASMASLFAIKMGEKAQVLEAFTYAVIGMTVVFQGLSAGLVARLLGLERPAPKGWLVVGAHPFSRQLSRFLREEAALPVWVVDTNARAVAQSREEGLDAIHIDAMDPEFREGPEAEQVSDVLALTDNAALNMLICQRWREGNRSLRTWYWSGGAQPSEEARTAGTSVFQSLPAPSILAHELEVGEARMIRRSAAGELGGDGILLAALDGEEVRLEGSEELPEDAKRLWIRRSKVALRRLFSSQLVVRMEAADQRSILLALLDRFRVLYPMLPVDATLTELVSRERTFPTALGEGLALPHAYSPLIKAPLCAVGLVTGGVKGWEAPDGVPIKLVFLLLSPKGDAERHLLVLGEIVRLLLEPGMVKKLMDTENEVALAYALIEAG